MTKKISFENEYALHKLTEKHLKELFDLEFVASEIQLNDLRLDNLAFDMKTNSFVIIEYKNEYNDNVLNQAQQYCDLVQDQENNEFFINQLNDITEVNFENIKVMIIGPEFSPTQIDESESNFELWKITLFDDGKVTYENLKNGEVKSMNINLDDLKLTEETLLKDKSSEIIDLYNDFKNALLNEFDDFDLKVLVDAVSVKAQKEFICLVNIKNSIKIQYYTKKLEDPENKTRDISNITTGGPLSNYELTLDSDNIDYAIDLIKQVYNQKVGK
jgi:predicted transport protein